MKTETGFELLGKFHMDAAEPPGLEPGQELLLTLAGVEYALCVTVTKTYVVGGRKYVHFASPMVTRIDPV